MMKTKPQLLSCVDETYARMAAAKSVDRQESRAVRTAVRDLGDMVYQRHGILHRVFKEFEKMTHERTVTNVQVKAGLAAVGINPKLEDIDRVIMYVYPDGDLQKVQYVTFFKSLMASYHDLSHVR